jgi:hypothetical protein
MDAVDSLRGKTSPLQSWLLRIAVCVGFPAIFFITTERILYQLGINRIDPYVYAAYINDYTGTFERFGTTYYSARIAFIFPERALVALLGLEPGYLTYRFLALITAAGAVFAIARRYYGVATGVFVAAWLCFTPWLIRSLLWTHYDGIAVVYLLVVAAFILVPRRYRRGWHAAAGAALSLAVNCNFIVLAVGGVFLPSWLVLHHAESLKWKTSALACVVAGFVIGYAVLTFAFTLEFPGTTAFSADSAAIATAVALLKGGSAPWFIPLPTLVLHPLETRSVILIVPLVLLGLAIFLHFYGRHRSKIMKQDSFANAALLYLGSVLLLALTLHVALNHHWLATFFYNVYFFPASALVLISLAGNIEKKPQGTPTLYSGTILLAAVWCAASVAFSAKYEASLVYATAFFALSVVLVMIWAFRMTAVSVLGLLAVSFSPVLAPEHRVFAMAREARFEWDVYRGAIYLQRYINALVPKTQSIGFWYSNSELLMYSVQSMFLWEFTRVAPAPGRHPGMPVLDESTQSAMQRKNFVALISQSNVEQERAWEAIQQAKLPFHIISRSEYAGALWSFQITLLKRVPVQLGPLLFEIPLGRLVPAHGARIERSPDGLRLSTAGQWAYSLVAPLQADIRSGSNRKIVVRFDVEAHDGIVGLAIEDAQDSGKLYEVSVGAADEMQTIDVELPNMANAGRIIVRNHRDKSSSITLKSIRVYEKPTS